MKLNTKIFLKLLLPFLFFKCLVVLSSEPSLENWGAEAEKKGNIEFFQRMAEIDKRVLKDSSLPFSVLAGRLNSKDYEEQYIAACAISKMVEVKKEQLDIVFHHPDSRIRCVVSSFIREMNLNSDDRMYFIKIAISDNSPEVRTNATFLVGYYKIYDLMSRLIENFSFSHDDLINNTASSLDRFEFNGLIGFPCLLNLIQRKIPNFFQQERGDCPKKAFANDPRYIFW